MSSQPAFKRVWGWLARRRTHRADGFAAMSRSALADIGLAPGDVMAMAVGVAPGGRVGDFEAKPLRVASVHRLPATCQPLAGLRDAA